ncbi:MAG: hypothetical protein ACLUJG_08380 [Lawsonibacter sp.]
MSGPMTCPDVRAYIQSFQGPRPRRREEASHGGSVHCRQRPQRRRRHPGRLKTMTANGVYAMSAVTALTGPEHHRRLRHPGVHAGISGQPAGLRFYRHRPGRRQRRGWCPPPASSGSSRTS